MQDKNNLLSFRFSDTSPTIEPLYSYEYEILYEVRLYTDMATVRYLDAVSENVGMNRIFVSHHIVKPNYPLCTDKNISDRNIY
jgi:hypothetical protein